jgi:hypothetical protein
MITVNAMGNSLDTILFSCRLFLLRFFLILVTEAQPTREHVNSCKYLKQKSFQIGGDAL